jgi:hypothetical protein
MGQFGSVKSAAKSYDIPLTTGQLARCNTRLSNCQLTDAEELTLIEWILSTNLFFSSYSSYTTPEFDLFCKDHLIITLCMPPPSLHLLQPLDVVLQF